MAFFKKTTEQRQPLPSAKYLPFQHLDDTDIEAYVKKRMAQKNLVWNETQLTLITQTLSYFFDTLSKKFIDIKAPGDAVWFLEGFQKLNDTIKADGYGDPLYGGVFPHVHEMELPLIQFASPKYGPIEQLTENEKVAKAFFSPLFGEFSKSLQFVRRWFLDLELRRLSKERCYSDEHKQQANEIAGDLIEAAIEKLKKSKEYQTALADGTLYRYSPPATQKPGDAKSRPLGKRDSTDSTSSLSSTSSMTSQEGSRSAASTPESEASPLQSASSQFYHPSGPTIVTDLTPEASTSDGATPDSGSTSRRLT